MRILYLYPRDLYDRKMSIGRVLYGMAVGIQPGVDVQFWGDGWDGYKSELSLRENIERINLKPTHLWFYKSDRLKKPFPDIPSFICFNECWSEKYISEAYHAEADTVIFHHAGDMQQWEEILTGRGVKSVHIPHCADPSFFTSKPIPIFARTTDCLLTGVQSPEVYPLRARFRKMILEGKIKGHCAIRSHPGYRLSSHELIRSQYGEYCHQLGQAKVVLCCSSKHGYLLQKYSEAAMAGCAIVTDRPRDSWFSCLDLNGGVTLDPGESTELIVGKINELLEDTERIEHVGNALRNIAMDNLTTDHYAQRLLAAIG